MEYRTKSRDIPNLLEDPGKKQWSAPQVMSIEIKQIRQEALELYYQMLEDKELFKLIEESAPII